MEVEARGVKGEEGRGKAEGEGGNRRSLVNNKARRFEEIS